MPKLPIKHRLHVKEWLAANNKKSNEVRWALYPIGMVERWIERAQQNEMFRKIGNGHCCPVCAAACFCILPGDNCGHCKRLGNPISKNSTWQFAIESVYGPLSQWGAFGEEIIKLCEWADNAARELEHIDGNIFPTYGSTLMTHLDGRPDEQVPKRGK